MTAADKLRELLATRPARPNLVELERWWQLGGEIILRVLEDVEAIDCDLVAERAELRRERDARAQLRVELDRVQREKAELASDLVCADRNRAGDTTALAERDAEIGRLRKLVERACALAVDAVEPPPVDVGALAEAEDVRMIVKQIRKEAARG